MDVVIRVESWILDQKDDDDEVVEGDLKVSGSVNVED